MQSESRNKILQTFFVLLPQNGSKALAIRIQTSQFPDKLSSHAGTANRGKGPTINRAEKMHSTPATEPRSLPPLPTTKSIKTKLTNLQTQIEERQKQLEYLEGKLRSGKIHLQDYEDERKSLKRQIVDLHKKEEMNSLFRYAPL